MKCPNCNSENCKDASTYESNGIYGPGSRSWKVFDCNICMDCGVHFSDVSKQKKP